MNIEYELLGIYKVNNDTITLSRRKMNRVRMLYLNNQIGIIREFGTGKGIMMLDNREMKIWSFDDDILNHIFAKEVFK